MKILMISSNYPPLLGGPASSVPYISEELVNQGFEVHIVTQGASGYPAVAKENGFMVHRTEEILGRYYYPHVVLRKIITMSRLARKIIDKYKINIVHAHDMNISGIVGCLANKQKLPSICKFGGDLAWEYISLFKWTEENPEKLLKGGGILVNFFEYIQKKTSDCYDVIAPNSEYQKQWLIEFTKLKENKLVVLRNGIIKLPKSNKEINKFKSMFDGDFTLSTTCRLVPWKGLQHLVKAVRLLPKDIELAIAGSGPYENELRRLTETLSLQQRIIFLGKISHNSVQNFILASNAFVLPSLYEPSAIALLDALMVNIPIVATDVGGTKEVIEHKKTGLLVNPSDPNDIAKKVSMLKDDKRLRKKIVRNQNKLSKKYEWKNVIKDYIDVYNLLV